MWCSVRAGAATFCDVFLPPQPGEKRPAILLVHGGGWAQGDRS